MTPSTIAQARREMTDLRARMQQELDAIDDNRNYSEAGRRAEKAKVVIQHQNQANEMHEQLKTRITSRRNILHKNIFGIPDESLAASYRDAIDRVTRTVGAAPASAQRAADMLETAHRTNDQILIRAIGAHAYNNGWTSILDTYSRYCTITDTPDLEELRQLPDTSSLKNVFHLPSLGSGVEGNDLRIARAEVGDPGKAAAVAALRGIRSIPADEHHEIPPAPATESVAQRTGTAEPED